MLHGSSLARKSPLREGNRDPAGAAKQSVPFAGRVGTEDFRTSNSGATRLEGMASYCAMKSRPVLDSEKLDPAAIAAMGHYEREVREEVADAVAKHPVVVVGMAQNPHVRNVRRALEE